MSIQANRRKFLKIGTGAAGAALVIHPISKAIAASCNLTPPQTSGPFYPGESQFHQDNDLTLIPGHAVSAKGQVIYVKGKVLDTQCLPIENANVEIWQACESGKYNNPKDPNPAPIDPHFKYWAETYTNASGEYWFKTIIPGAYPASDTWVRPPHIHFKITRLGYQDLVTQMYFKGNDLNSGDLILQQVNDKNAVLVDFQPSPPDLQPGSLIGHFDITLKPVQL